MYYGLNMGPLDAHADPRALAALAHDAEEAGWDGFFIWDVLVHDMYGIPRLRKCDPWIALAAIATSTARLRLGPMIAALPRRRPWTVARQAATLDHLCGGRLVLGVGIGDPAEEEYGWFGEETDARVRAAKLDESLAILAGLWSGQPFSYDGAYYHLHEMTFAPPPLQQPRIPIWVGGWWPHKAPMRRAARWDGVQPGKLDGPLSPDEVRALVAYIMAQRSSTAPFDVAIPGTTPGDDPVRGVAQVAPYAEAGATWWIEDCGPDSFRPYQEGVPYVWPVQEVERRIRQGPPRV